MKTPRQILFERHRSAEQKLDAIRQASVAAVCDRSISEKAAPSVTDRRCSPLLREIFFSLRWHLTAMSAVWLLALLLNMDHSSASATTVAKQNPPSPQQLVTALLENRRQIAELTSSPVNGTKPIIVPHSFIPPRRSEFQSPTEMA